MSTEPQVHVKVSDMKWWATAIIIPGLGLILTVVIMGTQIVDKIETIGKGLDAVKDDLKGVHIELNGVHGAIDTLKNRQLQYHYENKIYQARTEAENKHR